LDASELDLVRRAAALARIDISEVEARTIAPQFARILEHFKALEEVDVEHAEPMIGATRQRDVTRPDEVRPSFPRDELLANAPEPKDGFYSVPKTIGGDT